MALPRQRLGIVFLSALALTGCASVPAQSLLTPQEHNDLGVAYQARGEVELAVREYRQALGQDLSFVRAWINLGNANLELGRTDEAIAAYEQALLLTPSDPEVLNNLAWALHIEPHSLDRAEALIRQAVAQNPAPRSFYLDTLGAILLKKGALEEASTVLEEGLRQVPPREDRGRAALLYHLGLLRLAQKSPGAAARLFKEAVTLDPTGPFGAQSRKALEPLADK